MSSALFLKYNTQLGPPFHVIVDTNFVNFSIKNKIDMMTGFMDCLYAKGKSVNLKDNKTFDVFIEKSSYTIYT